MFQQVQDEPRVLLVAGLDTVRKKNMYQFRGLAQGGWRVQVLTWDSLGDSRKIVGELPNLEVVLCAGRRPLAAMAVALVKAVFSRRPHVAEIYPYSTFALLMVLFLRLAGIPVLAIARGQEYLLLQGKLSRRRRLSLLASYRLSTGIAYKEPYMASLFTKLKPERSWLLANAISLPKTSRKHGFGGCRFLFLNSIREIRNPEVALVAFLRICDKMRLTADSSIRLDIVGFRGRGGLHGGVKEEARLRELVADRDVPVGFHPWASCPENWLDAADVFLLPSEVVFLNYSLLEAMGRGIPPIVQDVEHSGLIVEDGVSGYLVPPDPDLWEDRMCRLLLQADLRERMGAAARAKVGADFSATAYMSRYIGIYETMIRGRSETVAS